MLALLSVLGCSKSARAPLASLDAGQTDAGLPVLQPNPVDAGPKPIPGARLTAVTDGGSPHEFDTSDGGSWHALDASDGARLGDDAGNSSQAELDLSTPDASVPDWAALTCTAGVPLVDFRTRLLGSEGQLVANHAQIWVVDGGTQVQLLPAPLWPSHGCCRLVVDGQTDKLPTGGGSRFLPFEVDFGVAADPERALPARPARRHRHRRRQ